MKKRFQGSGDRVIKSCREIMRQWKRQQKPCPHDFYWLHWMGNGEGFGRKSGD